MDGQLAAHSCLSMLWQAVGGYADARRHAEAILALATRTGHPRDMVVAQNNLTWHEIRDGDLAAASRRLATVLRLADEIGDARLHAVALANLAEVARLDGRYAEAVSHRPAGDGRAGRVGDPSHRLRASRRSGWRWPGRVG